MKSKKIAIVTPLRNEVNNIDRLFDAISKQTLDIFLWLILENCSTDGSIEKLKNINCPENVEILEIINLTETSTEYKLGLNYARIINHGFNEIKDKSICNKIDYVGILDSDIFLEEKYYEKLLKLFDKDSYLGITSGIIENLDGSIEKTGNNWVRGGCRLWKKECFYQSGYIVGPSADSLSAAKAICNGWKVYPSMDAIAYSRPVGSRVNYQYYGEASFFRGCSILYILIKSFYFLYKLKLNIAYGLIIGYFHCFFNNRNRINDSQVLKYYRYYPLSRFFYSYKNKKMKRNT